MSSAITPGMLAVIRTERTCLVVRVLRIYTRYVAANNPITIAEALPLVDLINMKPFKERDCGNFVVETRFDDLHPWDHDTRRQVFDHIQRRVYDLEQTLQDHEHTLEKDPPFQVAAWKVANAMSDVKKTLPPGKDMSHAEMLCEVYGDCYPNAHLRCKIT